MCAGFSSFIAALCTSMPINVYAQNNGIISFTLCASRTAGVAAGIWLVLFGVIGKVRALRPLQQPRKCRHVLLQPAEAPALRMSQPQLLAGIMCCTAAG